MSSPKPPPTHRHTKSQSQSAPTNPTTISSSSSNRADTSLQSPAPPSRPLSAAEDDDDDDPGTAPPDLPLSMSTSLLLSTHLPPDTTTALITLHTTLDPPSAKVNVRFTAIGSAPILKQKVFKISASSKFGAVVSFLRKRLGVGTGESLFCYVNNVFAPGLDEGVGNLHRCFKTDDQLIVAYSKTPAFG